MKTSTIILVEIGSVESGETVGATVRDRNPDAVLRQPGANSQTNMQVVIDDRDTAHNGLLAAPFPTQALMALILLQRISAQVSFRPQTRPASALYRELQTLMPSADLQNCNVRYTLVVSRQARDRG